MPSDLPFENLNLPSVSIIRTTPKISEEELFSYKRCYMGISLDNSVFEGKSLQALLLWMTEKFEESLVIVGDYLWRFNEQIFGGLETDEAIKAAQGLGDSFIKKTREIFQQLTDEKVHLTRWKQYLETDEYKKSKSVLSGLFASDSDFRASVEKDAFAFVRRQTRQMRKSTVPIEEAIKLCSKYLLEEIAVFSALSEQGWHVELYPGPELRVLVDIAKGKYLNIPQGLKERINVELKICERSYD
ncbi:MAG: tRNA-dependent cyclodipeptide synthase [Planctomycetota bacterium]